MKKTKSYYDQPTKYNDQVVLSRVQKQFNIIKQFLETKEAKILDVGSYGGLLLTSLFKSDYKNLYACDIFDSSSTINVPVKFSLENITQRTSFRSNYFDFAIVSHVIEHICDVDGGLDEMKRIMKSNGYLLLAIPLDVNISARLRVLLTGHISDPFNAGGHIKFFRPEDIEKKLHDKGFKIIIRSYSGLGYGKFDQTVFGHMTKLLANVFPSWFAGEVHLLLQKQ